MTIILPPFFQRPTEQCKHCLKTIPEKTVYCPYCGLLHNSMNVRYRMRIRRSTRLWCRHCFHSAECYSHEYCTECGYHYNFRVSKL